MRAIPNIPGLEIQAEIGRGASSVVYRALKDGVPYAVKVSTASNGLPVNMTPFRREAALLACLSHPSLIPILDVGQADGRPYIVMELVEGETLARRLVGGPISPFDTVNLGCEIAGALDVVHRAGFIHRDVKPKNIVVGDSAKLIDFGFAARTDPGQRLRAAGTLAYAPPEQIGVLQSPVDGRSDLYSLGAVLYECLVGRPPFEASGREELVQAHLRTVPRRVDMLRVDVGSVLADVIEKLLAKHPDDRYQTAGSLLADLGQIDALQARSSAGAVVLGAIPGSAPPAGDARLVGRQAEFGRLRQCWRQALRSQGSAVLIEGETGLGKSQLALELVDGARRVGTLGLIGRCSAVGAAPFCAIRTAIEGHLESVARLGDPAGLRDVVRSAAAHDVALIAKLSPLLVELLDPVASTEDDPNMPERFVEAIADFIARLAEAHSAAVLFLDDIHLLDGASRRVIAKLATKLATLPLVIVATARNDQGDRAAIKRFAEALGGTLAVRLELAPVSQTVVGALMSKYLAGARVDEDLVETVWTRTRGNPFAVWVYVQAMLDAGLLRPSWGSWIGDGAGLDRLRLPTDVLQLVLRRLETLTGPTRTVLGAAAVIGDRFDVDLVRAIVGVDIDEAIREGHRAHLIESLGPHEYSFVHQRVREALVGQQRPADRTKVHRATAEALEALDGHRPQDVYALAYHRSLGAVEPAKIYAANLAAGRRAIAEYADEQGRFYLERAHEAGQAAGGVQDLAVYEALADVCARTGRIERAIAYIEASVPLAPSIIRKAELHARLAFIRVAYGDYARAWNELSTAFATLGHPLPRTAIGRWFRTGWDSVVGLLSLRLGRIGHAAPASRDKQRVLAQLFEIGTLVAFYNLDQPNLAQMTLRPLRHALAYGPSRELVNAYVNYAMAHGFMGDEVRSVRMFDAALALADRINDVKEKARTLHVRGTAMLATGQTARAERMHIDTLESYGPQLEPLYFLNGCMDLAWMLYLRGYPRRAFVWVERAMTRSRGPSRAPSVLDGHPVNAYAASSLAAIGRVTEAQAYLQRYQTVAERSPSDRYRWAELLGHQMAVALEVGEVERYGDTLAAQHATLGLKAASLPMHLRHYYVFAAHGRLDVCRRAGANPTEAQLDALAAAVAALGAIANIPLLRAHHAVVDAALARWRGREDDFARQIAVAESLGHEEDAPWVLSEAAYERAVDLGQRERFESARREASAAAALASESGRSKRAREIGLVFDLQQSDRTLPSVASNASLDRQRHLTALLRVSLASATEVDPEKQARVALDEIVSLLRAERAFLLLTKPGSDILELQVGRDGDGNDLTEMESHSRTAIETVRKTREPLIVNGRSDGAVLGAESVVTHGLRSIIAAPLMLRERLIGVVYLDNRLAEGIFTDSDVEILLAIGNHIAIALETVRIAQAGTYERVSANVPGMVFQMLVEPSDEARFLFVSQGCRDLFGVDADAVTRDASILLQRIHPDDREDWRRSINNAARTMSPWRWEGRSSGLETERWIQGAARPERQGTGAVRWDGLLMDITTRRVAEDTLERQARELVRSNADLEQFAYVASHDLQEPLRVVASYLQLLTRRYRDKLDDDAQEFIDFAVDGATRMQSMIKDLLQYSRVGTRETTIEPCDMSNALAAACNNLRAAIDESDAAVESAFLPTIPGDETQLSLLLQNLIGNAIKFRSDKPLVVKVEADLVDEVWRFRVADNGIGIDPRFQGRIFGIFQRLHTRGEYKGSGIGLAICKKIVERHGGRIWLESAPGEGTTFYFTLPTELDASGEFRIATVVGERPRAPSGTGRR